jgi:hypothetical protein
LVLSPLPRLVPAIRFRTTLGDGAFR